MRWWLRGQNRAAHQGEMWSYLLTMPFCFPIFQQLLKPNLCKVLYTEEEMGP